MTNIELDELEGWLASHGYRKYIDRPALRREDYYWAKSWRDPEDHADWQYMVLFLVYDWQPYADRDPMCKTRPFSIKVEIYTHVGEVYDRMSHSLDWGNDNLDDIERLAADFHQFIKERIQ